MKRGFSLIELLVVVGMIILLATIAIPNFLEAQVKAKRAKAVAELSELSKAIEAYFIDHREYPATDHSLAGEGGWGANRDAEGASTFFRRLPTWRVKQDGSDELATLTTPIAYIGAYPSDVFARSKSSTFSYSTADESSLGGGIVKRGWIAWSVGPGGGDNLDSGDGYSGEVELVNVGVPGLTRIAPEFYNPLSRQLPSDELISVTYDPTNGSRSPGILYRIKN